MINGGIYKSKTVYEHDELLDGLTKEKYLELLERKFVDWMVTQRNSRGTLYLERVVW